MGKHTDENEFESKSGELPVGEKKDQLAEKAKLGDHVADSSTSPIETF